jgi:acetyl esterase/lipase
MIHADVPKLDARVRALAVVVLVVAAGCRLPIAGDTGPGESSSSTSSSGSSSSSGVESTDSSSTESTSASTESSSGHGSESDSETGSMGISLELLTLAYGRDSAQMLDLYLPQPRSAEPLPTLVLAHGGLWQAGGKEALADLCQQIVLGAGGSVACASIGYRLSQDLGGTCRGGPDTYEQQLRDFGAAVAWLQNQAETYALDPARMFVGGHSAGGHLAHVLNLRWDELAGVCNVDGGCPSAIAAIGIEGIYDITAWDAYDQAFWNGSFSCATHKAFGASPTSMTPCIDVQFGRPCWEVASPTYLANHAVELGLAAVGNALMIHSPADDWVDIAEAGALGDALAAAFPNRTVIVSDTGACASGDHNALLAEPALASCLVSFVLSGGTAVAP